MRCYPLQKHLIRSFHASDEVSAPPKDISTPEVLPTSEAPEKELQPTEEEPAIMQQPPVSKVRRESVADEVDLNEIWAEAEFYYQQGLFDEARKHYAKIIEHTPGDRRVIDRLTEISREEDETKEFTRLAEAVESLEDNIVPETDEGAFATSVADEEAVRRLMMEIAENNKKQTQAAAPPKATPLQAPRFAQTRETARSKEQRPVVPPQRRQVPPVKPQRVKAPEPFTSAAAPASDSVEEEFFDLGAELQKELAASGHEQRKKSEDYFDLASELRDEISTVTPTSRPSGLQEDQSLDDIFEEFKKGVERQAISEDSDTHYNLGVAYKEMGLLDDAISEFILTPEGEPWFVQSRYMLGLCYLEKGGYQNAITEFRNTLNYSKTHGIDDQDRIGMQYDLGLAYQGIGNTKAAIAEFQKVATMNPKYRDTGGKLKELRKGDFISLEQLKDDIEKEISAKFLQEGERIEREEKSKKAIKSGADRA